jgi:phosphatidate cytidylyltransferase
MKRVATAAVLIPSVLWAVYRAPFWLFVVLVGIVALLSTHEFFSIIKKYGLNPVRSAIFATIAAPFLFLAFRPLHGIAFDVLLLMTIGSMMTFVVAMRRDNLREATLSAGISFFAVPYIGLALLSLAILRAGQGAYLIVMIFIAVWVGDTAAYYVGRTLGRRKLAPTVSPKKTWEGAIASALFSALAAAVWAKFGISDREVQPTEFFLFSQAVQLVHSSTALAFSLGLIINIAAQFGDLAESMIKRGAGVKDSGTILPGHGGILDRIDALLFAAPVALLLFTLLDRFLAR